MKIRLPENSLVVCVGPSGSGKSTFVEKVFGKYNVVATDDCRRILANNPLASAKDIQKFSEGAFVLFHNWVRARLRHGLLTVADSTALRPEYRNDLFKIGVEEHVKVVYLYFDTPFAECVRRDSLRPETERVGEAVIKKQFANANRSRGWLRKCGDCYWIKPDEEIDLVVTQAKTAIEAKAIDVIGDVHGCLDELVALVEQMGYVKGAWLDNEHKFYRHPEGRKLVFVGDLIDRGPEPYKTLDFVRQHVLLGEAELVLSNHERKLRNWLSGHKVNVKPEFQKTIDSIPADVDKAGLKSFLYQRRPYLVWEGDPSATWVVAHAAFDPKFLGKIDHSIEEYCVYGPVRSVDPVSHFPDRIHWWETYRPGPQVVYGHVASEDGKPRVVNGTWGIDTGCVHGLALTALRLPERTFSSVQSKQMYYGTPYSPAEARAAAEPNMQVLTSRRVTVRLPDGQNQDIFLRDGGIMDAVDKLSTRTIRPDKLRWLAPTMSPGPVSEQEGVMEDPVTTAKWLLKHAPEGTQLIAEEKHMGSHGTWFLERSGEITCWTRNGYEMFDGPVRSQVYDAVRPALLKIAGALGAKELILDSEVMPFNQHGADWLERTFMTTAAAGHISRAAMARAASLGGHKELAARALQQMENIKKFGDAANEYCWQVAKTEDIKVGLFGILHPRGPYDRAAALNFLSEQTRGNPMFRSTSYRIVTSTTESLDALARWFDDLTTGEGIEGVVLKYLDPQQWSTSKYPQQCLKVRGRDYLRVVYGPSYLEPEILAELRRTRREAGKMKMSYQQTLLGREALQRAAEGRPFESFHECIIAILAAERATVDPRL